MRKREADNVPRVEIKELRAVGLLSGKESGAVYWRSPFYGDLYRFAISNVFIDKAENTLPNNKVSESLIGTVEFKSIMYIFKDKKEGWRQFEEPPIWQSASLSTTPCNYGKVRFWFHCPGLKGKRCLERVGVLYWLDDRLACRKCHNLTYRTQNIPKTERRFGKILPDKTLDDMWEGLKKYSYQGKPTKRYLRVQKKTASHSTAVDRMQVRAEMIGAKLGEQILKE
jgi:hypothetical protein